MTITPLLIETAAVIPLMAALPYSVEIPGDETGPTCVYDPETQLTVFAGGRDFSTCREDESAGGFFSSKTDTKKDD